MTPPDHDPDALRRTIHDLRTPLIAILGYVDQALELARGQVELAQRLYGVHDNAHYLLDLIAAFAAGTPARTQPADVDTVADCLRLLRGFASPQGVDLRLVITGALPERLPIPDLALRQICYNLIGNAIAHAEGRPVTVTVDGRAPTAAGDGCVTLTVRDHGRGIPPAVRERIFEPYAEGAAEGRGLGLYICRKLAEQAGGDLALAATGPDGTTFELRLTVADDGRSWRPSATRVREEGPSAARAPLAGQALLVVSPRTDQRLFLAALGKRLGARIAIADEAEAAAQLAAGAAMPWRAVLIDVGSAGHGPRLIATLAAQQPRPRLIAVTSDPDALPPAACDALLVTPCTPAALTASLGGETG